MPAPPRLARWLLLAATSLLPLAATARGLPPEVAAALAKSRIPEDSVTLMVADAEGRRRPRLAHRTDASVNPASVTKLVTTFAALELLGPAFTWNTPVLIDGPVRDGTLQGNLYLKGQGDPKLVAERLWLLLRRVQGLGIRRIAGDIVIDRSAFAVPAQDPAAFDGEPLRPYNAAPDALLVNFRAVLLHFTPLGDAARVQMEPPLAGVQVPRSVPLANGPCNDWRGALKADFSDPARVRLEGTYPAACGARSWPLAGADPAAHAGRAVAGLWQELGGALDGVVREGAAPAGAQAVVESVSPTLAEVVRDVNKYSNNVMAQQVFLTLSLQRLGQGTPQASRELVQQWWRERLGGEPPQLGNGSGLSREERITAAQLARLLQHAWASPLMPEFIASLPVSGLDGTARRTGALAAGRAHLKTGSLRDVTGVAGYVHLPDGRRRVLVAIANHPRAGEFRPVIDALIDWTLREP
ncbi:D-alanyl-D-alanine carboxypeptidase/D-alanyl-D-alanine-endopeptidase [Ramlibacter rhizophilus]|uniref:D-alanyl-D-alanine carboxypeptidase/D-alanyl-D-alanine-endopeptidase n=1 Tax=Ramlibacter rhizophilus TaxID=1781167 RepID=A0A4Z0BEW7_9BURK|nr:D-alanyl-D-alanine carboxypeptidase/D-alanyl-D-alanine-endopeptidase [Ramlibacter rhizophilus]TFY97852.1 D-alanyl-D-alanine carboxypeptidase/D-alanyl-D-alanine-endopeptidase [Ramlibacter rhizophilus]